MQAAAKVPRRRTAIIGKVSNKNEFASTHFCTPMITIQPSRIIWKNILSQKPEHFQNQQLWDLGLPGKDMDSPQVKITLLNFSVSPPDDPNSLQVVKTKIQQLDTQFDFVLLAEFFDESLVSLALAKVKSQTCVSPKTKPRWSWLSCFAGTSASSDTWNSTPGKGTGWGWWQRRTQPNISQIELMISLKVSNITLEARTMLTEWLTADYQLYNHFKAKFHAAVESYGKVGGL